MSDNEMELFLAGGLLNLLLHLQGLISISRLSSSLEEGVESRGVLACTTDCTRDRADSVEVSGLTLYNVVTANNSRTMIVITCLARVIGSCQSAEQWLNTEIYPMVTRLVESVTLLPGRVGY